MDQQLLKSAMAEVERVVFADAPIPKLIHMTVASKQLEGAFKHNIERITALNPGWVLNVYDDNDIDAFLRQHYGPAISAIYATINPRYGAARADFFRYLCVHALGGLYLDLKSTTAMPLDDWLRQDDRYILSQWDNGPGQKYEDWGFHDTLRHVKGGEFQQWFIASAVGHPFLRCVIERVLRNVLDYGPMPLRIGRHGVVTITGPIAYTLAIHPLLAQWPNRSVNVEAGGHLRYSIFDGERDHYVIFKNHYSRLREPIIKLSGLPYALFLLNRASVETMARVKGLLIPSLVKIKKRMLSS
jgi:mannosyltransferase OCH1-like enzyme